MIRVRCKIDPEPGRAHPTAAESVISGAPQASEQIDLPTRFPGH